MPYVPWAHLPTMPSEITLTGHAEQIAPALREMLEIQQPAVDRRHEAPQPALALEQRPARQVLAVDAQYIEGVEVGPLTPEQQILELCAAVRRQAADFAIEHTGVGTDGVRELLGELRPLCEGVAAPGDELAVMAADAGQRPEPIELRLEHERRMIERLREAEEPHGGHGRHGRTTVLDCMTLSRLETRDAA